MRVLSTLFRNNRHWAAGITRRDPEFFQRLSRQQVPQYLWIGCSDSRVPANEIVGLAPGELFVHRNVANVVVHTDLNCLSVIQYAVEALRVRHIIVCGHYGCGGVLAALRRERLGLIDNWLRHVQDVRTRYHADLRPLRSEAERHTRLCELNVAEQAAHVCETTVVQGAWARGQSLAVHGWIYSLSDGLLRDLGICISSPSELAHERRIAPRLSNVIPLCPDTQASSSRNNAGREMSKKSARPAATLRADEQLLSGSHRTRKKSSKPPNSRNSRATPRHD